MKNLKFIILSLLIFPLFIYSKPKTDEEPRVENIRFRYVDGKIIVNYDLIGPMDREYNLTIRLKRESEPSISYEPKYLEGKYGKGLFAGKDQQIIWDVIKENLPGFTGTDYYFEISGNMIKPGSNLMYYIGGGAVLIGGGAAILLLSKKSTPTAQVDFPLPEGRPK
jgi:hypothetical protein